MLYNVHTHHPVFDKEILCIENISGDFDQELAGRNVSMGLHPWFLEAGRLEEQLAVMRSHAEKPEVWAIGECGLDKVTDTVWDLQLEVFRQQIMLVERINKPLIIHCVRAFPEVLAELRSVKVPVIFHGVNNKRSVLQPVIDAGHYLSFGKGLLSTNESVRETFIDTPLDKIFLETDDAAVNIREIYKSASIIKKIDEKEIVLQLEKNFETVFRSSWRILAGYPEPNS